MIIDFTISNFRSIKEKQTFSLYAEGAANHLKSNIAHPAGNKIGVLRTAGIYGANASGKSNLLLAFKALRYLVTRSGELKDGDQISCYEPYLLSETTKNAPISFELEFATNNKRYIYEISFTSSEIVSESLNYYPGQHKAKIFTRDKGQGWEDVTFGSTYTGGKKKYAFFKNNSYISKAGNSADAPEIIRSIYNYIRRDIFHLGAKQIVKMIDWRDNPIVVQKVGDILSKIDTGISGIKLKEEDGLEIDFPTGMPEKTKKEILDDLKYKTIFLHEGENNRVEEFTERMESSGTIKLFEILPLLIDAFDDGGVVIIDELDSSFHPHIAELLISLFNNSAVNANNAQLIFSTHNINLMSPSILRRDQIWFTEKKNGATIFYSLDEYNKSTVKTDSPYSKWYDEGRFGAIPNIDVGQITAILSNGLS